MSDPNATPPPQGGPTPPPHGGPTPPSYGGPTPYPHPGPTNYGQRPPARPAAAGEELAWGSAAHWSSLVAAAIALAFLGPLIVMLTKGNESPWVRRQAVESLNFQLSILIYGAVSVLLCFVLIGFVLLPLVGLTGLVCTILGSIRAGRGEDYRYPFTIRMVR